MAPESSKLYLSSKLLFIDLSPLLILNMSDNENHPTVPECVVFCTYEITNVISRGTLHVLIAVLMAYCKILNCCDHHIVLHITPEDSDL